jgi:DNA processing protein
MHLPGFGPVKIKRLIERFGSPNDAFLAEPEEFQSNPVWMDRKKFTSWENDLRLVEEADITLIPYFAPNYPARLRGINDAPMLLYVKGTLLSTDNQCIAIIGTRFATPYGMETAESFGQNLARAQVCVTSGLARGIDTAAHKGALRYGRTIAVIGSGLGELYPPENRALANSIAENGAIISEYPMLTPPSKLTFPQRNRIVSGMSRGVLLIEAPEKSGAMITMDLAHQQGKTCWALPGRVDFPSFEGNHSLIKKGKAKLATKAGDVLDGYDDLFSQNLPVKVKHLGLTEQEQQFLSKFPAGSVMMDELCRLTQLPVAKISVLLMGLVFKNIIKEVPGQRYQKR